MLESLFSSLAAWHQTLWGRAVEVGLLTACVPIGFNTIRWMFGALLRWQQAQAHLPGFRFKQLVLVSGHRLHQWMGGGLKIIYVFAQLSLVYLYISILFSLFNTTKHAGEFLLGFLGGIFINLWSSIIGYLPNLVSILLIIGISTYLLKFLKLVLNAIASETIIFDGFHKQWAEPTYKITRFLLIMMVLIMIFPLLPGFNSPAFQGIGVFLGLLLSIGSSSAIANIMAGIVLIYTRSFDVGDRIETNGVVGDVMEKSLLVTRIKTINEEMVTIPNSAILNTTTMNFTEQVQQGTGLILHTSITIGYDVDWRTVHQLLHTAAQQTADVTQPFEVFQTSLDDFYVTYELRVKTQAPQKMAAIYSQLHQHILDTFHGAGVEICSPHYRALREHALALPSENSVKAADESSSAA